jgi:hypothetical protein
VTTTDVAVPARRRWRGGRVLRTGHVIYWWAELLFVLAFYGVYSTIRNVNKSGELHAYDNARRIIRWEHDLGIFHEATLERWALHFKPLIIGANYYYGSFHFAVTVFAIVFLYRRFSDEYPLWRNTLAVATALALIGFNFFPLMPPRLLYTMGHGFGFVDTLQRYPTFWSFDSGGMQNISNQFAAMPSVHCAWAGWCALVLGPRLKRRWARVLAWIYPALTVGVIVITANHYFLDAVGGFIVLTVGYVCARVFTRAGRVSANGVTGLDAVSGATEERSELASERTDHTAASGQPRAAE